MTEFPGAVAAAFAAYAVLGKMPDASFLSSFSAEKLREAFVLAKTQSMAALFHRTLAAFGLETLDPEVTAKAKAVYQAVLNKTALQDAYAEAIYAGFEEARIPFIPLKGEVLRDRYPEIWMRTGSDVDILVKKADLEAACGVMTRAGLAMLGDKTGHDVAFTDGGAVRFELHYTLLEDGRLEHADEVCARVWDYASPLLDGGMRMVLTDAFIYAYHLAHMAKHMFMGGCGMRPFLDLYLLNADEAADKQGRAALAEACGLAAFAAGSAKLAQVWYGDGEADAVTRRFAAFIVSGGSYGNLATLTAARTVRKGKARHVWEMFFPSFPSMVKKYPQLEKKKRLLPLYYGRRFIGILREGRGSENVAKLAAVAKADKSEVALTEDMFKELGLK